MNNFTVFIFDKTPFFDNNTPRFPLPIIQENAFLNNRIVILLSNHSKCVFLNNKKTASLSLR